MLILPAIDLRDGKCVRLVQGDYDRQLDYAGDPAEVAKSFEDQGAHIIHVVDLDGAKSGEPQNLDVVERICRATQARIEFGGGVRSLDTAHRLLAAGVHRVVVGTKLIQDPDLAETLFGLGEHVVAGIDAKNGFVATQGWLEESHLSAVELAVRVQRQGARRIILTDIARDGMLTGPNTDLLTQVMQHVSIPVIHSGGIGTLEDLKVLASLSSPPEGAITGRAIYDGKLDLRVACATFQ